MVALAILTYICRSKINALQKMLKFFKYLALIEGYSFLFILFLTMPLKYLGGVLLPNKIMGMAHGILFLSYVVVAIVLSQLLKWNFKKLLIVLSMSVVPFGTFWMEDVYIKEDLKAIS
jgi:integral membrane protein